MRTLFNRAQFLAAGDVYDAAIDAGAAPPYDAQLLAARVLLKRDENRAVAFLIRRPPRANARREPADWALQLAIGYARMRDFERADHHFEMAKRIVSAPADRAALAYQLARRYMLEKRLDEARRWATEMAVNEVASARGSVTSCSSRSS